MRRVCRKRDAHQAGENNRHNHLEGEFHRHTVRLLLDHSGMLKVSRCLQMAEYTSYPGGGGAWLLTCLTPTRRGHSQLLSGEAD